MSRRRDRGPVVPEVALLSAAIDHLAGVECDTLDAAALGTLIEQVDSLLRRLDHERHRLLGRFSARDAQKELGYVTPGQWGADRLGCNRSDADAMARIGRLLGSLERISKRWAAGDVSADHVRAALTARRPAVADEFDADEGWFADHAAELTPSQVRRMARCWVIHHDPLGEEQRAARAVRDRDGHVSVTFDDTVAISAVLPAVEGRIFDDVFRDVHDELFHADWSAAKEALGREPKPDELERTPAQRRADTFVELARRARAHTSCTRPHRQPRPLVTVVVGLDALAHGLAETWDGCPLTPRQLAAVLADCEIERIVYGPGGVPIAHHPRRRLSTGALRHAIEVRDRRCTAAGCDTALPRCQVDHITPWAQGGLTTPGNGRLACEQCNRARPNRRFPGDAWPPGPPPPPSARGPEPP